MTVGAALEKLRTAAADGRLDDLCSDLGIQVMTVFGSAVSDPVTARDIDVAVAYRPTAERDDLRTIDALMTLTGFDAVDLLVLDDADPTARRNATVGVLPLYEAEAGAYAHTQMAAVLEFLETGWLRRLDLELLAR